MRQRFGSVTRAVVVASAAVLLFTILSMTGGVQDRFTWRLAAVAILCLIALVYMVRAFVELWRKDTDQVRWGDTVTVIADAPHDFNPGATGVVKEIRYLSGIRVCLVTFDGGDNVVPERFLKKLVEGGKAWNRP